MTIQISLDLVGLDATLGAQVKGIVLPKAFSTDTPGPDRKGTIYLANYIDLVLIY